MEAEKQWIFEQVDENISAQLQASAKVSALTAQLLIQRGITTATQTQQFFNPTLEDLHNPFLMKGMDAAVLRISTAIRQGQKILLYGDYDVDGTTSVATAFSFFSPLGAKLKYYIPDRYKEGYGLTSQGVQFAIDNKIDLVIAMDCGTTAIQQAKLLAQENIDFIICDHHIVGEELPQCTALLNPKQPNCHYPYKELSGCGVVFKLAQAYCIRHQLADQNWKNLLDFLVLSIACDIVPMTGENRVLAKFGLQALTTSKKIGIQTLLKLSKRYAPITISDIVFGVGPLINAAGRMGDAAQAVQLLLASNKRIADNYSQVLNYRNKLRKEFDQRMTREAEEDFLALPDWETRKSIVLYRQHWHKGIAGIVAARMTEKFNRPTIILAESNDMVTGSARSIKGFNIHHALTQCASLLHSFGGHAFAAGLTLSERDLQLFDDRFEGIVATTIEQNTQRSPLRINATVDLNQLDKPFLRQLGKFAPFGPENRNPVFVTHKVQDTGYSELLKSQHLRLSIKQQDSPTFGGIAFYAANIADEIYKRQPFSIAYTITTNKWKGKTEWKLMAKDFDRQ